MSQNPHGPRWWINRKSKLGTSPIAKEPPPLPNGRPWWTTPPTTEIPDLSHIEFAVAYHAELLIRLGGSGTRAERRELHTLTAAVGMWINRARRMLHDQQATMEPELATTEGMIIRLEPVVRMLAAEATRRGFVIKPEDQRVLDAFQARAGLVSKERAERYGRRIAR